MTKTSDGLKLQPQFDPDLAAPTFAEDLTALSDFFAARSFQHYATVANVLAATSGKDVDDVALVAATPGAWWRFNGSAWEMRGTARFADFSALTSAFTGVTVAPGWKSYLANVKREYMFDGSNWVSLNGRGPFVPTISFGGSGGAAAAFDPATGIVTCTTVTSVSMTGLTGLRAYRFRVRVTAKSAGGIDVALRVISGTTPDATSGNYRGVRGYDSGGSRTTSDLVTSQTLARLEAGGLAEGSFEVRVVNLNENVPTFIHSSGAEITAAAQYQHMHSFRHNASPSNIFNGIQLLLDGAGTFSCEIEPLGEG